MKNDSIKKFMLPHLLALVGPLFVWGYLYFRYIGPDVKLFEEPYIIPTGMGFILGVVFGYLICLVKWMSLWKRAQSEPPDKS